MRSRKLTIDQMAEIALDRYRPLASGGVERPIEEIATELKLARGTVASAIRTAFKEGAVEIRRVPQESRVLTEVQRLPRLEAELKQRFRSLFDAIVVLTEQRVSDFVHRDLGYALARSLGGAIGHRMTLGLGSGRGPYWTVAGLNQLPRLSRDGITLMSLTGAVYPEAHSEHLNVLLDADFHTGLLGVSFSKPITQRMVSYPIAPKDIEKVRKDTWLAKDEFPKHVPDIAIVGVGVLRRHHRFYEAAKMGAASGPASSGVGPILDDLIELVRFTDAYSTEEYCPVADVCNRLFFVEPPQDNMIEDDRQRIKELIAAINKGLLTITEDQLGMIGGLILVAGTKYKAPAIRKLLDDSELEPPRVRVRTLCTDASTAELILKQQ